MVAYTVREALDILRQYGIAEHIEVVRRWLRNGTLKGTPPASRKQGWRIDEGDLRAFMLARSPGLKSVWEQAEPSHDDGPTDDTLQQAYDKGQVALWWTLMDKFVVEGTVDIGRQTVSDLLSARRYSPIHQRDIKDRCFHKVAKSAKRRVYYLHDAFIYHRRRITFDIDHPNREEAIALRLIDVIHDDLREGH